LRQEALEFKDSMAESMTTAVLTQAVVVVARGPLVERLLAIRQETAGLD
jgi:hypothetical protein